jgi:N-acetylglutamate synthase-like GNAT family acetyltransferase
MIAIWIDFGTPEYDEVLALRYEILRKPLGLEYNISDLKLEYKNMHLAIYANDYQLLGSAMLSLADETTAEMRQVAVRADVQGKGIGRALVTAFEQRAQSLGFTRIFLAARKEAVAFYEKLGYKIINAEYLRIGIPHFDMEKML